MLKQWLRFPFAMAGPVSAAVLSIACLVGLVTVIALPKGPVDPYLVAGGTLVLLVCSANVVRTRYARRRGIDLEAYGTFARAIPNWIAFVSIFTGVFVRGAIELHQGRVIHQGWVFVIAAPVWFGLEALFVGWARWRGQEWDERWAIDSRVVESAGRTDAAG